MTLAHRITLLLTGSWKRSLLAVLMAGLSMSAFARDTEYMPLTLTHNHAPRPFWVDVSVALDASGNPDGALLGPHVEKIREIIDSTGPADCHSTGTVWIDSIYPPDQSTLERAIETARISFIGRVTDKSFGFSGGIPGQLLQVRPERSFSETSLRPVHYVFMPVGSFQMGGARICQSDDRYPEAPEVGDEIILFAGSMQADGMLVHTYGPDGIVTVTDGKVRLPRQYLHGASADAKAELERLTRSKLLAMIEQRRPRRPVR